MSSEFVILLLLVGVVFGGAAVLQVVKAIGRFIHPHHTYASALPATVDSGNFTKNKDSSFETLIALFLLVVVVIFISWDSVGDWFNSKELPSNDSPFLTYAESGIRMKKDDEPITTQIPDISPDPIYHKDGKYISKESDVHLKVVPLRQDYYVIQFASGSNRRFVESTQQVFIKQLNLDLVVIREDDGNFRILYNYKFTDQYEAHEFARGIPVETFVKQLSHPYE